MLQGMYVYILKEFAIDDRGGIYANLKMQKSFYATSQNKSDGVSSSPLLHHSLHTPLHLHMARDTKVRDTRLASTLDPSL